MEQINEELLKTENGISIEQLEERLEFSNDKCCINHGGF